MARISSKRAVTAMFRAFGREAAPLRGDSSFPARRDAMHRGEWKFLAVAVPLVLIAAAADLLGRWSAWVALLGTLPAVWLLLNVLPFLFRASRPLGQWLAWAVLLGTWAAWRCPHGGWAACVAIGWLGVLATELLGWCVLGVRRAGNAWRAAGWLGLHAMALVAGYYWGVGPALAVGAVIAGAYCAAVLRPSSQLLGQVRTRVDGNGVLITIDDGPDPRDTPMLLDLLDRHQAKAVFFVIGAKAEAHPEWVREIVRRGHELGNHTQNHPQASFWCAGPVRTRREIAGCQAALEAIAGVVPRWFRAPVGHRNLFTHPIAAELGLEVVAWKRRGYDAVCADAGQAVAKILHGVEPGDIILMHEATPIAGAVLEGVLMGLRERGLKPCAPAQSSGC